MKKLPPLIALGMFMGIMGYAQLPAPVQEVVNAENRFAATSKEKSTRAAFLSSLAEEGIVFSQGNPTNGQALWTQRPENNALLFWWPVFADVSSSGDFGYTTGPFEVSPDRSNPVPSGFGYYSSVWKKNDRGEWKVAIDMGIGFPKKEVATHALRTSTTSSKNLSAINYSVAKNELLALDTDYAASLNKASQTFEKRRLSAEARIHRTGNWPYTTPEAIQTIDERDKKFLFEHLGGDVATSGDMGYCYGKVTVSVSENGQPRELNLNYLRIWKKEGNEWRIVLDVIGG